MIHSFIHKIKLHNESIHIVLHKLKKVMAITLYYYAQLSVQFVFFQEHLTRSALWWYSDSQGDTI